jgi:site-specific recombinase XerD
MASGKRLRLKLPGWRAGELLMRVGTANKTTYNKWRDLVRNAYKQSYFDVLDAVADKRITLAKATELSDVGGLLAVRRHLEELAANAEKEAAAKSAEATFTQWFDEFIEQQPRKRTSPEQHAKIRRHSELFLDYLVERHEFSSRDEVPAALWTADNLARYVTHYINTQHAATRKRLEAEWAAMDDPPTEVDQKEELRKDLARKAVTANRHVNGVGAFSQFLLSKNPSPIACDPAKGNRISTKQEQQHREDDYRSLSVEQWRGLRKWSVVLDSEDPRERGTKRPDTLWYDWLVASGATTYTEGTRLRVKNILDDQERDGMVPVQLVGSKAAARRRKVDIPRKLADRLIARAKERRVGPNRAIFPFTARRGSNAWAQLLELIAQRDPVLHARIHDVTPYALRHTFAVMALRNGADIYQLKRLMGHANITTTEIYLKHAAPPRKALARMARHLGLAE